MEDKTYLPSKYEFYLCILIISSGPQAVITALISCQSNPAGFSEILSVSFCGGRRFKRVGAPMVKVMFAQGVVLGSIDGGQRG